MKIDFHSHILPGLDDGATSIDDSVMLVNALKDWGFERITCTPHITNLHPNTPDTILSSFNLLNEEIEGTILTRAEHILVQLRILNSPIL